MPDDRVGFEDRIVAAVVDLRLQHFKTPVTPSPQMLHHLAGKQVFQERFSVRGSRAVNVPRGVATDLIGARPLDPQC